VVSVRGGIVQEKSTRSACLPFPEGLLINGCGPNCYAEDEDVSPKFLLENKRRQVGEHTVQRFA